jgi:replicative DNA helicase
MNNESLEKAVLAALILSPHIAPDFFSICQTPHLFYEEPNKVVAEAIKALYDRGDKIDLITVVSELKKTGGHKMANSAYVAGIVKDISTAANWEAHTRILLEMYMKRELYNLAVMAVGKAQNESIDIFEELSAFEKGLHSILNQSISMDEDTISNLVTKEAERWEIDNLHGIAGHRTGIDRMDEAMGGLVPSDLVIIAARPGQGKTALILSVIRNLCKQKLPVGIFSLEMSSSQLTQRILSQESGVFASKIRNNDLNKLDKEALYRAAGSISSWPIYINDQAGIKLSRLKAKATIWKKKYKIQALFVDYLQLITTDSKKNGTRENEISEISRGLKVLAKDLQIPVIALSQLSRSVEQRPNKLPQLSDLRESGSIEQDADSVLFIMRPEYYKMNEYEVNGQSISSDGLCILEAAKLRHGAVGTYAIRFNPGIMQFTNYGTPYATPLIEPVTPKSYIGTKSGMSFDQEPF